MSPSLISLEQTYRRGCENVVDTPKQSDRKLHHNFFPSNKVGERTKATVLELRQHIQSLGEFRTRKIIETLIVGHKEGHLEKQSNSLFTKWKSKYCRLHNDTFTFYADATTGRVSTHLDFKRVPATLDANASSLCFLYIWRNKKESRCTGGREAGSWCSAARALTTSHNGPLNSTAPSKLTLPTTGLLSHLR
eukprot:TRINITY_DN4924_c0_g1_i4.p1 TRINITY_DN4924_c0_g1~~TRINITY_DN4924_c0_g1_i4.p1  ORF type:complete len:192 (-),score=7.88 TRINITY_DN4924_c0_g1_i4:739-1314(-)